MGVEVLRGPGAEDPAEPHPPQPHQSHQPGSSGAQPLIHSASAPYGSTDAQEAQAGQRAQEPQGVHDAKDAQEAQGASVHSGDKGASEVPGAERPDTAKDSESPWVLLLEAAIGCGLSTPWMALLTCVDYFSVLFPAQPVAVAFAITHFVMNLGSLIFQLLFPHYRVLKLTVGFTFYFIDLGLALWMTLSPQKPFEDGSLYFWMLTGGLGLAAAGSSLMQSILYGFAGEKGPQHTTAFMNGQTTAALLICTSRILSKAFMTFDDPFVSEKSGAGLHLALASSVVISAACGVPYLIGPSLVNKGYEPLVATPRELEEEKEEKSFIVQKMWHHALAVAACNAVFCVVYPVASVEIPATWPDPNLWMPIVLITSVTLGQSSGRLLAFLQDRLGFQQLLLLGCVKILIVGGLVFMMSKDSGEMLTGREHDAVAIILFYLIGGLSGFLTIAFIVRAQQAASTGTGRGFTSTLMLISFCIGATIGGSSSPFTVTWAHHLKSS